MTRNLRLPIVAASLAALLSGCGNSGSGSGLSTAAILGEAPASASADRPGIKRDDPMARPVQVAWTSARAQKCGFNFDPARLKADYIASEHRAGADANRLGQLDKTYDMTVNKIKATIPAADQYCTDRQSNLIKADLQRHLGGNYDPNFPEERKAAGFFDIASDQTKQDRFDSKTLWKDLEDKKNGTRRSD